MAYIFELSESVETAIRRVGVEQLENARKRLIAKKTATLGVHEARKNLKKSRSLLRLIRPIISRKEFRSTNIRLRDIARALAGTRDIQAMVETTIRIKAHYGLQDSNSILQPLFTLLGERKKEAQEKLQRLSEDAILTELEAVQQAFASMDFADASIEGILNGFRATYSDGKRNMELAYAEKDIEAFHEWRKFLQHHWRQLQLLVPIWPEMMNVQVAQASHISEILGNHNDLSILIDFIEDNRDALRPKGKTTKFLKLCDQWRVDLREEVRPFGERAFAEKPSVLCERFAIYWATASAA